MDKKPPVNLNLKSFKFPITAIVSILHRISGVAIFLLLPLIIYCLHQSLASFDSFSQLTVAVHQGAFAFFFWVVSSAFIFHILAGLRHMVMDFGVGESFKVASITAWCLLVVSFILIVLLGVWIWIW